MVLFYFMDSAEPGQFLSPVFFLLEKMELTKRMDYFEKVNQVWGNHSQQAIKDRSKA